VGEVALAINFYSPLELPLAGQVMQKRHVDSLLYSSIALLAFSTLGFVYLLWETYRMAAK